MTKSESFSWQSTNKGCTGLNDFGLLRDTPEHDQKPKAFSLYFSRTVLIVGIVAGFTFAICLTLADKYQKSANISHHYASYIYEKDGEKLEANRSYQDGSKTAAALAAASASAIVDDALLNTIGLRRVQNISKNIRIDDINRLMPITTVLHTVNGTRATANGTARGGRAFADNAPVNSVASVGKARSKGVNLAELLKSTELKTVAPIEARGSSKRSTTEANAMQFAQLENYKHHVNAKNLQDLLKYVTCGRASDCGAELWQSGSSAAEGTQSTTFGTDADFAESAQAGHRDEGDARIVDDDQRLQAIRDFSSSDFNGDPQLLGSTNALPSESSVPVFFVPYDTDQQSKTNIFEQFHNYRVSNPMDINELEPVTSTEHRFFHRFSNRMYHINRDGLETPRMYTSSLEPYLKPPTPPPTALSFTPSYTTAIFQGFEDGSNPQEELKAEATAVQPKIQIKPISLMVEIFPATDYELPGTLFQDNTQKYSKSPEQATGESLQSNNPLWLPWKLAPLSQNKMRLFVNLFPQHSRSPSQ